MPIATNWGRKKGVSYKVVYTEKGGRFVRRLLATILPSYYLKSSKIVIRTLDI